MFFKQQKLMSTVGKSFCTYLFDEYLLINADVLVVMIKIEMRLFTSELLGLRLRIIRVRRGVFMTALRQSAMRELEKLPEDKISFVLQIMQGVNGLYNHSSSQKKNAFARLEQLRKKGTVADYDAELVSYREEKYGK